FWYAQYDYDNQDITTGLTAALNSSKTLIWNSISSYWEYNETKDAALFVGYQVESASESTYGLAIWIQTASNTTIVWDRLVFYSSGVLDGRIDVGSEGSTYWSVRYEYDSQDITSGLIASLNNSKTLVWNSISKYWDYNETKTTVQLVGYTIESASEGAYGLTAFVQITSNRTIIWDRVEFYDSGVIDGRIDVSTEGSTWWKARYDYDDQEIASGLTAALNISKSLAWNGISAYWDCNETKSLSQLVGYQIESAFESAYGLTTWVQTASNTTIIWDRIVFYDSGVEDGRLDIGATGYTWWKARYEYDDQDIAGGLTITLNGSKSLLWDTDDSRWEYGESKDTVQLVGYRVDSISASIFGLTAWTQTASNTTIIWDQIEFYLSGVIDERIDVSSEGSTWWRVRYDYDDTEITSGLTAELNGSNPLSWNSISSYWEHNETTGAVQLVGYKVSSASELAYGLAVWTQTASDTAIIWDRIEFYDSDVVDGRIDVNVEGSTYWYARYDYDDEEIASGLTALLNGSKSLSWNSISSYWDHNETGPSVQLVGYQIDSASESAYDLTAWIQTASNTTIIWDRIEFYDSGVTDGRINVDSEGIAWWKARYDYDDQDITVGLSAELNGSKLLAWNSISLYWEYNETKDTVQLVGYRISSASESTFGLTVYTQAAPSTTIIWDRIEFYDSGVVDGRIDVNTEGSTWWRVRYDYDDQEIIVGLTAALNDSKSLTWNGISSHWEHNETESMTGFIGYELSLASESTYDLTAWVQTAPDTRIVWDRMVFHASGVVDGRIDVNTIGSTYWSVRYEYDGQDINSGLTATLNVAKPLSWNSVSSYWEYNETKTTVRLVGYSVESASESTFGLTTFAQTTSDTTIIWDRIEFYQSGVVDGRIDVNAEGSTWWRARYDYDDQEITVGITALLNGSKSLTWNGISSYWEYNETEALTGFIGYGVSLALESTYGLTGWVQAAPNTTIIWDRVVIYDSGVEDGRIDLDATGYTWWKARYEYDGDEITSGF
ncbi:MAG: hypothetical protein ACXADO_10120, partial [Candidatus Thorarchaeota archaeon]